MLAGVRAAGDAVRSALFARGGRSGGALADERELAAVPQQAQLADVHAVQAHLRPHARAREQTRCSVLSQARRGMWPQAGFMHERQCARVCSCREDGLPSHRAAVHVVEAHDEADDRGPAPATMYRPSGMPACMTAA